MTECNPEFTESGECPIGDLVIRINRPTQPAEVWRIEGELVNYEVDPDRTIKLILVPTYNIPNLDDVTRRAMISHPAKTLVVLPILRKLTKELADCRTAQSNHELKLNFVMSELEDELARQKKLVEELQSIKSNDVVEASCEEQKGVEPLILVAPPINANLLVKVQKQFNECKRSLAEKTKLLAERTKQLEDWKKQEDKWKVELRQSDERRKQDAEQAQKERARITKEAEERLARELQHKDEDYDERLRLEKEKMEASEKQLQRRMKTQELENSEDAKVRLAANKKMEEENARLRTSIALQEMQREAWEQQKRSLEASAQDERGPKEKKSRPDYPPPHVLRKPPPPPRPAPPPPKNALRVGPSSTPMTVSTSSSSSSSSTGTVRSSSSQKPAHPRFRQQAIAKSPIGGAMPPPSGICTGSHGYRNQRYPSSAKSKSAFKPKHSAGASPVMRTGKGGRSGGGIKPQRFSERVVGGIQDRIQYAILHNRSSPSTPK